MTSYGSITKVRTLTLLIFFLSNLVYANFVKTDMPFDMVAVGEACYFRLSNNLNDYKYKKSISLTMNNNGIPVDINGYFISDFKISKTVKSIEVQGNGDAFVYHKEVRERQYLSKIELYDSDGKANPNQACFIKQGFIYKL